MNRKITRTYSNTGNIEDIIIKMINDLIVDKEKKAC